MATKTRPRASDGDLVTRIPAEMVPLLDGWIALQREATPGLMMTRPEAVRTILRAEFDRAFTATAPT